MHRYPVDGLVAIVIAARIAFGGVLFAVLLIAGLFRSAGVVRANVAGLSAVGSVIVSAGVGMGVGVVRLVGRLVAAAARVADAGALACRRVAGISGGYRAANACQQRKGDRARC